MAVVPAIGWWVSHWWALALASAFLAASLAVEVARRWWPFLNRLLWEWLPSVFREWEGRRVLGSTWFAVGALATLLLFGRDVGGTAFLFLAWGDPAAELVGRKWGLPGPGKTWIGSLGCFVACMLAGVVGISLGGLDPWSVLAGSLAATVVERWSPSPNDNVWVPLLSGSVLAASLWLRGG
jgi:dolichol kinase